MATPRPWSKLPPRYALQECIPFTPPGYTLWHTSRPGICQLLSYSSQQSMTPAPNCCRRLSVFRPASGSGLELLAAVTFLSSRAFSTNRPAVCPLAVAAWEKALSTHPGSLAQTSASLLLFLISIPRFASLCSCVGWFP